MCSQKKNPQSMSFPIYDATIFTYIQNNSLNYSYLYFNPYGQHTGRKTILHQMVAGIPKNSFALNFFIHIILICQCHSEIFKIYQIFKDSLAIFVLCVVLHSLAEMSGQTVFSVLISRPTSLLATKLSFCVFLHSTSLNYHHWIRRCLKSTSVTPGYLGPLQWLF